MLNYGVPGNALQDLANLACQTNWSVVVHLPQEDFLYTGLTFAVLHSSGTTFSSQDLFMITVSGLLISALISFKKRGYRSSVPGALSAVACLAGLQWMMDGIGDHDHVSQACWCGVQRTSTCRFSDSSPRYRGNIPSSCKCIFSTQQNSNHAESAMKN